MITHITILTLLIALTTSETIIDSEFNNGLWIDDFACDNTSNTGWSNCKRFPTTPPYKYHGIYTDTDGNAGTIGFEPLSRTFKCSKYSTVYTSYSIAMDCNTEQNQADGVTLTVASEGPTTPLIGIPKLDKADAMNSGEPKIPTSILPNAEPCNNPAPWDVVTQPKTQLGIIGPGRNYTLTWAIGTTHSNDAIVVYNISIWCEEYPTSSPSIDPTIDPTYDPTSNPTTQPTHIPTTNPTNYPTHNPTIDPTSDPTTDPTVDPTTDPTADPTTDPTTVPTYYPTYDPTIDPTADPTTDPTADPTIDPTIDPTYDPTADPTIDPTIDPTSDPTHDPTQDPTYDPIGIVQTEFHTTVQDKGIMGGGLFIQDAYGKFEATVTMNFTLLKSLNRIRWEFVDWNTPNLTNNTNWTEISKDIYKNINIYTAQIIDIDKLNELGFENDDLVYTSVLTIDAIRVLNSGYCYNATTSHLHLLQPGMRYGFRIYIVADSIINDRYDEYFYSDVLNLTTNQFATGGQCILELLDKTSKTARLLDKFYFECTDWEDPDSLTANFSLKFNGLMNDVLINNALLSESWTDNPSSIIGVIGTKALKITALLRDDLGAITCFPIDIDDSFPSASISDEEILEAIRRIIRENKLGEENSIAVALDTILEGLLYIGYANDEVLSEIMQLIVTNVVDTSYATNPMETSSGRVLSESIMMKGLLSENRLIFPNSASLMVDAYLPQLYSTIDQEIITAPVVQLDQSIGDSLNQIGLKSLNLADKLESFMTKTTELKEFDIDHNKVLESFVEFSAYSGHIALAQSYPGAEFEYFDEDARKKIFTKKIDPLSADNIDVAQHCGVTDGNNIQIPPIFGHFYDCSAVDQLESYFEPKGNVKKMKQAQKNTLSNTFTVNLYHGDVYNSVFDTRRRRMVEENKRRRLQGEIIDLSNSLLTNTDIEDRCNPYFLTIFLDDNSDGLYKLEDRQANTYHLGKNTPYPACTFWNTETKDWDENNCFVYNYTESEVLCACRHLTTFNIKASDFKPEANVITWYHFRSLNKTTLLEYPFVWITLVVILVLFLLICILDVFFGKKDDSSPLAYKDIMFTAVRDSRMKTYLPATTTQIFETLYSDKHKHYGVGLIKSIRKDNKLCTNQLRLYKIYLYDNHTLLSVFQHSEGTGYTRRERIASFYLYLSTIMVSSAVFYGVEQQKFGDITASFLVSLWSTIPAVFTKFSFKKSKPNISPITINIDNVSEWKLRKIDLSKLPTDVEDNELKENDIQRYNEIYENLEADKEFKFVDKSMMDEINEIIIRSNHKLFRMAFLDYIRVKLLHKDHSWPHIMRWVGWIFLILWCAGCSMLAILYGIQFDLLYKTRETAAFNAEGYNEACYDMNPQLLINEELSAQQIEENEANLNNNFGSHVGDSSSWLIQLFQSVIVSIFVWQPLTIYIITWLNIWLFSWNLPITLKPPNLIKLVKNVIGVKEKESQEGKDDTKENKKHTNETIELHIINDKGKTDNTTGENKKYTSLALASMSSIDSRQSKRIMSREGKNDNITKKLEKKNNTPKSPKKIHKSHLSDVEISEVILNGTDVKNTKKDKKNMKKDKKNKNKSPKSPKNIIPKHKAQLSNEQILEEILNSNKKTQNKKDTKNKKKDKKNKTIIVTSDNEGEDDEYQNKNKNKTPKNPKKRSKSIANNTNSKKKKNINQNKNAKSPKNTDKKNNKKNKKNIKTKKRSKTMVAADINKNKTPKSKSSKKVNDKNIKTNKRNKNVSSKKSDTKTKANTNINTRKKRSKSIANVSNTNSKKKKNDTIKNNNKNKTNKKEINSKKKKRSKTIVSIEKEQKEEKSDNNERKSRKTRTQPLKPEPIMTNNNDKRNNNSKRIRSKSMVSKRSKTMTARSKSIPPKSSKKPSTKTNKTATPLTKNSNKKKKKKKKKRAKTTDDISPVSKYSGGLVAASLTVVQETITRYSTTPIEKEDSKHSDNGLEDNDNELEDEKVENTPVASNLNKKRTSIMSRSAFSLRSPTSVFQSRKSALRSSISPFSTAVERCIRELERENEMKEKEDMVSSPLTQMKSANHFDDLYQNIVSHRFRPFDEYAFFGTNRYFLDIVKTWYGLDIKGYEKPEPVVEISESESEEEEEEKEKKEEPKKKNVQVWRSAVSYA